MNGMENVSCLAFLHVEQIPEEVAYKCEEYRIYYTSLCTILNCCELYWEPVRAEKRGTNISKQIKQQVHKNHKVTV